MTNDPKKVACVVDTNILIDFLRGREYSRQLINRWSSDGMIAVSALTHLEIYSGVKSGEEIKTIELLNTLETISIDANIARSAGYMIRDLRLNGKTIGLADAIIAITAIQLDVPLLTNNISHYPMKELKVIKGLG